MFQFFQEEPVPEAFPGFEDVKEVFDDASPGPLSLDSLPSTLYQSSHVDIDPEQIIGMKDFALHDAMMAIEVRPVLCHTNVDGIIFQSAGYGLPHGQWYGYTGVYCCLKELQSYAAIAARGGLLDSRSTYCRGGTEWL